MVALHGWPQHHYVYRDLLADPPPGLRVIAPDLPGYGWSGPAPHDWAKEDIASDVFALLEELDLEDVLLVGHDWGGFVSYLMALREPDRISGFLALNIAHPWQTLRTAAPHFWRFMAYQPLIATLGVPIHRHTSFVEYAIRGALSDRSRVSLDEIRCFSERFREPTCAETARDTYRTFLTSEVRDGIGHPETRRLSIPVRVLHGVDDVAIHSDLVSEGTAKADDYEVTYVEGCGHFIADERPDLVREHLIALAVETAQLH